jgi:hypothetical protein
MRINHRKITQETKNHQRKEKEMKKVLIAVALVASLAVNAVQAYAGILDRGPKIIDGEDIVMTKIIHEI